MADIGLFYCPYIPLEFMSDNMIGKEVLSVQADCCYYAYDCRTKTPNEIQASSFIPWTGLRRVSPYTTKVGSWDIEDRVVQAYARSFDCFWDQDLETLVAIKQEEYKIVSIKNSNP